MRELAINRNDQQLGRIVATADIESPPCVNIKQLIASKVNQQKYFYSMEVMPLPGIESLNYSDLVVRPLFTSITWLSDVNLIPANISDAPAIQLASLIRPASPVLTHLTCTNLSEKKLVDIMCTGVQNVFALRGDRQYDGQPLRYAIDLVRTIRETQPNLSIGVGGYPDIHPDAISFDTDLQYLKEKIDAGADFIITQFCFSFDAIANFILSCRSIGITCPIIVGILVPVSYDLLLRLCELCRVSIPSDQLEQYTAVAGDAERFHQLVVDNTFQLIDKLFNWKTEKIFGIHLFSINKFDCVNDIIKNYHEQFKID